MGFDFPLVVNDRSRPVPVAPVGWRSALAGPAGLAWQPMVKTEAASAAPNKHKQDFLTKGIDFPFVPRLEGTSMVGCKAYALCCQLANEGWQA